SRCGNRADWRSKLLGTPLGWALTLAVAGLGVYLFTTHAGHILSAAPYLLLLLCPLMHLFGHGGHGDKHRQHNGH
ncbi:MAG: hypothetical protein K0R41_3861, partial [Geminicoccaceae bacterium]|nr:hypothetical protein [Geminicoccaceae bacterium]